MEKPGGKKKTDKTKTPPRKKKIESSADEATPKEDNPAGACIQYLLELKYTSTPFLVFSPHLSLFLNN